MRVVFMGTPDFAVPALDRLMLAGHEIACVYTRAPQPAGRGKRERPSPVHRRADDLGLPVRTPRTLRSDEELGALEALDADVGVVVAYGLILPQRALDAPRRGCLNIHASLLPRWRGAAPIHRAVMAGDGETGVAIMAMEAGLDTGPVLLQRRTPIGPGDTAGDLHDRLAKLGAEAIAEAMDRLDDLEPTPQAEAGASYAEKIDKSEAKIDWRRSAVEVDRLIRGLSPFPGAWTEVAGERVKLLRSRLADGQGAPGEVLCGWRIACGTGAIDVTELQRPGRRAMSAEAALRGMEMPPRLT